MSWSSGSALFDDVWDAIKKDIPEGKRIKICKQIIKLFEARDCDTIGEGEGDDKYIQAALRELHPDWYRSGCDDGFDEE